LRSKEVIVFGVFCSMVKPGLDMCKSRQSRTGGLALGQLGMPLRSCPAAVGPPGKCRGGTNGVNSEKRTPNRAGDRKFLSGEKCNSLGCDTRSFFHCASRAGRLR